MNEGQNKEGFRYRYSAKEQNEVERIRQKYLIHHQISTHLHSFSVVNLLSFEKVSHIFFFPFSF